MQASSPSPRRLTRRSFVALASSAVVVAARGEAAADVALGDDGLYHEPWFLQSFLDLRDDLEGAASSGKRLAVMWELHFLAVFRFVRERAYEHGSFRDFLAANG